MLVNGRNILDACWLVAHDARISLGVEKVKRKQLQRTGSQVYAEDMQRLCRRRLSMRSPLQSHATSA